MIFAAAALQNAASGDRCKVTDPTGTPLNVLSAPNGKIIGTLANGVLGERDPIRQRAPWVDVADYKKEGVGLGFPQVRILLLSW